jgi:hypothetical protein
MNRQADVSSEYKLTDNSDKRGRPVRGGYIILVEREREIVCVCVCDFFARLKESFERSSCYLNVSRKSKVVPPSSTIGSSTLTITAYKKVNVRFFSK